ESIETKFPAPRGAIVSGRAPGEWRIFAAPNHPLAEPLREEFARIGGSGAVVCLPENPGDESISLLLGAGHAVLAMKDSPRFVVVQPGDGGGGFARTLHLENPAISTCVVNVPTTLGR